MRLAKRLAAWLLGMALMAAGSARGDETTLIFATGNQTNNAVDTGFLLPWAARINEAGMGIVHLDIREGMSVVNIFNAYDRVQADVAQISWTLFNYVNGKIKLAPVAALPFVDNATDGSVALWRLYKTGMLDSDFDQVIPLVLHAVSQSQLHTVKPLKDIFDWGGTKIVTPTKIMVDAAQLVNGTPLSLGSREIYEAIQRGTAQGASLGWTGFPTFKLAEVLFWHVDEPLGTSAGMVFMSRAKFNALPEPVKKVLLDNSGEEQSRLFGRYWDRQNDSALAEVKASPKHTVISLSPEQRAQWLKKLEPATETWTKETPNGAAVVGQYKKLLAEIEAGHRQ
jgi:TRAP-type C4-dicarboxylate transport system substrate-binding protein